MHTSKAMPSLRVPEARLDDPVREHRVEGVDHPVGLVGRDGRVVDPAPLGQNVDHGVLAHHRGGQCRDPDSSFLQHLGQFEERPHALLTSSADEGERYQDRMRPAVMRLLRSHGDGRPIPRSRSRTGRGAGFGDWFPVTLARVWPPVGSIEIHALLGGDGGHGGFERQAFRVLPVRHGEREAQGRPPTGESG